MIREALELSKKPIKDAAPEIGLSVSDFRRIMADKMPLIGENRRRVKAYILKKKGYYWDL